MTNTTNTSAASGADDNCTILPDGSAFAVGSFPLPQDHWLYATHEYEPGADEPKELLAPILTHAQRNEVVAAVRYAVRGATMCGKVPDFDPDALVQNAVYALCGSFGRTALATTAQASPQQEAQEPFAWHVCSVNSDGSLSLEHAAAWEEAAHEHINDAITEHDIEGAGSWVVRPAYHAPQPSPAAQGDALDTMRLDWLDADEGRCVLHLGKSWYTRPSYGLPYRKRASLREAIDAARAAQESK